LVTATRHPLASARGFQIAVTQFQKPPVEAGG
jgi:hypothetical protein